MGKKYSGINSSAVHAGEKADPSTGSVIPPIYQTTTFAFETNKNMLDLMEGKNEGYIYTRYGNPNFTMVEEKVADMEDAERGLVVSSGMMAIYISLTAIVKSGGHIISHSDLYGGTFGLFYELLPDMGIEVSFVDPRDLSEVENAVKDNTGAIFLETPSNPSMRIYDIKSISELAHKYGVWVIADNTFATPFNQNPLEQGADVVVHSCTKYLNGHSDLMAGIILGDFDYIETCVNIFRKLGGTLNGFDAWLLLRGLKTLGLRMKQHNKNGRAVAEFLKEHDKIEKVFYPGLSDDPGHETAKKQMYDFGGMLSFEIRGGQKEVDKLLDEVRLFTRAVSLGSVESLITQPIAAVHYSVPQGHRDQGGISDNLVRISAGIEESEDIIADLKQALDKIL